MRNDRAGGRADLSPFLAAAAETLGTRFEQDARHHDETGAFPFANFDAPFEAGLLGPVTPAHRGGLGGNPGLSRADLLERHHRDALAGEAHAPRNNLIRGMAFRQALCTHAESRDER